MQAAERGFKRIEDLVTNVGRGSLIAVLNSLAVTSLDHIADLDTLKRIVVALEAKTQPIAK